MNDPHPLGVSGVCFFPFFVGTVPVPFQLVLLVVFCLTLNQLASSVFCYSPRPYNIVPFALHCMELIPACLPLQVLDGAPVEPESIPIRMYLGLLPLTPTVIKPRRFAVRYLVSVDLVDQDTRRYFKETELHLYRTSRPSPKFSQKLWGSFSAGGMVAKIKAGPPDSFAGSRSESQRRAKTLYQLASGRPTGSP